MKIMELQEIVKCREVTTSGFILVLQVLAATNTLQEIGQTVSKKLRCCPGKNNESIKFLQSLVIYKKNNGDSIFIAQVN